LLALKQGYREVGFKVGKYLALPAWKNLITLGLGNFVYYD